MSSQEFFSIIVDTGLGKIIKAQASNSNLTLTKMAVGDSKEPITQSQTSMLNQRHKFNINSLTQSEQDPNILIAEGVIPSNVGGFYIHQVAVYDDDDELFAIAKVPATYKPNLTQGSSKDITIKFQMKIDNATNITLKVDNSITLATRDFVITELAKKRDKADSYSMTQSDERFLGIRAKAVDSNLLDGKDSSLFVLKTELSSLAPRPDLSPYLLRSDTTESPISNKVPKYNSSSELQASKFKMGASSTSMSSSYYPAFVDNNGYIQKASISSFLSAIGVYSKSEVEEKITSSDNSSLKQQSITTQNLDEVNNIGIYIQGASSNINEDLSVQNYPVRSAGVLEVTKTFQRYTANNGATYHRSKVSGSWRSWNRIDALTAVGVNQVWRNMRSQRQGNVIYTNTTGRAICVNVTGKGNGDHITIKINGNTIASVVGGLGSNNSAFVIVPDGNTYEVYVKDEAFIQNWTELR